MKKITLLLAAAAMVCASAMGQDQDSKKKGGFWNKVKKGVESTTGLKVSGETLFVYPTIGQWKMKFISAVGDPSDNTVVVKFGIMPTAGQDVSVFIEMASVTGAEGQSLPEGSAWKEQPKWRTHDLDQCPLFSDKMAAGTFSEFTLQPIRVPEGMKLFKSIGFNLVAGHDTEKGYEMRNIPITWEQPQTEN